MFIAMNRFLIKSGKEELFEEIWKSRETHLDKFPGFLKFNLLKGITKDDVTLYASHTEWVSKSHFDDWIKSEAFRKAHKVLMQIMIYMLVIPNLRDLILLYRSFDLI